MRKLSLLLLACLTLGIAWAERVSVNTAQQVAANVRLLHLQRRHGRRLHHRRRGRSRAAGAGV